MGFIYFLRAPADGRTKIGFTADDPNLRLRRLRATCPGPVEPLGLMEGPKELEREVHTRFAADWCHGEWFRESPELSAFIAERAMPWEGRPLAFRRKLPVDRPRRPAPRPAPARTPPPPPGPIPDPRAETDREIRRGRRMVRKSLARCREDGCEPDAALARLAEHYGIPLRDEPAAPPPTSLRAVVAFEEAEPRGVVEVLECGHRGKRHRGFASAQRHSPDRRKCRECLAASP